MRPPDKRNPITGNRDGAESRETGSLGTDDTTIIMLKRERWHVPMVLAYRIGRLPPHLKPHGAKCWRVSVQAALGQEVRHV